MFTGIIQSAGQVVAVENRGGDRRLRFTAPRLPLNDVRLGDSIAVNGVCLTAVDLSDDGFAADVSGETLALTTVGSWRAGTELNLEKSLTLSTPLGGHLVSGHVDGVGEIVSLRADARSVRVSVRAPNSLARYIAAKGSICVDGVSLTVNRVDGAVFELNLVPHTLQVTTLKHWRAGTLVNLEVDLLARYLERLLLGEQASAAVGSRLDYAFLQQHGFAGAGE